MIKIAFASGKGGTGKTTISTNTASYLSEEQFFPSVVLVDLDVEEPNSGLFFSGKLVKSEEKYKYIPEWDKDKCSFCGACDSICNFNALLKFGDTVMILPELCHSCFACSELCPEGALPMKTRRMGELKLTDCETFSFIESRLDIGQEQAVPIIAQTIDFINNTQNVSTESVVILDSPPGTSCPVIEVAKNSDYVILVTEPTPFGLHDLGLAVNTMREIKKNFAVVINRYGIGDDKVEKYCKKEGINIIAKFPNMRKAAEIYSRGKIIYKEIPEFRIELKKIADFISSLGKETN